MGSSNTGLRNYLIVTSAYWSFTLTDGALRMLVVFHFHELGYSTLEIAFLFLFYEFFGIVTNLYGGWLGARFGLRLTLWSGTLMQVAALLMLIPVAEDWPKWWSVAYVMVAQAISGIAKDLNKMSAKSAIKTVVPETPEDHNKGEQQLFRWVAILTGSKNALKGVVREALRIALVNLHAEPAPAGMMDVVLGPGWPGILLHEAIGHGLEGDFNRKGSSAFAGLMGQQIAAKGVTVLDDGTIPDRRGSITIDDEGTPSAKNVLIEDGVLVGYMQDRQNARLMGVAPTGNGRRESYQHAPMPRMTNTYMLAGDADPAALVADLKDGIYAVGFGGGQVDITNGKFVFSCTEAYRVKDGIVGAAVKGATLIGDGATALKQIQGIGNDLELDPGIGNCGKAGQWVPVGVGQPSLKIGGLTIGGAGGD